VLEHTVRLGTNVVSFHTDMQMLPSGASLLASWTVPPMDPPLLKPASMAVDVLPGVTLIVWALKEVGWLFHHSCT
jgi:hypothetical protein